MSRKKFEGHYFSGQRNAYYTKNAGVDGNSAKMVHAHARQQQSKASQVTFHFAPFLNIYKRYVLHMYYI